LELIKDGFGPLDKSFGEQESSHKNNTVNPEFNETFSWQAPDDIGGLVVEVIVMDGDIGIDDDLSRFCKVEKKLDNKWFSKDAMVYLKVKFEA
jgi:C2 domain